MAERISIVTDEISRDLGEVRQFLDQFDLRAVELRMIGDRRVPDLSPADRATLAGWARDGNPVVLGLSPGLFKCRREDQAAIRHDLEEVLPRSIELALALGVRFLVAFTLENPTGGSADARILDVFRAAAETCATAGLPLLLENEPGHIACHASEVRRLLDAATHPNLFVNWDPLNGNEFGTPELAAGLRSIFTAVRHIHVKNGRLPEGGLFARCGPLAEGAIDWPAHLALLCELGYAGHFGVETHFEPVREGSAIVLGELRGMLRAADPGQGRA